MFVKNYDSTIKVTDRFHGCLQPGTLAYARFFRRNHEKLHIIVKLINLNIKLCIPFVFQQLPKTAFFSEKDYYSVFLISNLKSYLYTKFTFLYH